MQHMCDQLMERSEGPLHRANGLLVLYCISMKVCNFTQGNMQYLYSCMHFELDNKNVFMSCGHIFI